MTNESVTVENSLIKQKPNWFSIFLVAFMHIAGIYAIFWGVDHGFSAMAWIGFGVLNVMTIWGVSVGYHRYFTHESFDAIWPIKLFLLICGGFAIQGHVIKWAANHKTHHKFPDREGDLHSPWTPWRGLKGLFWAHMGWALMKYDRPDEKTLCARLLADKLVASQKYWVWLCGLGGLLIPYALWGWEGLLLAGMLRLLFAEHAIFAINSICHKWGDRPYNTKDKSTNNIFLGWLIPSGEPFHNNHHADPKCAYLAWRWYQPDLGKWTIQFLSILKIGHLRMVWNVHKPRPELMERLYNQRQIS